MPATATPQSRVAGLAPGDQTTISGVALGEGDITRGLSGDKKFWPSEELEAAAGSLEGTPVKALHSETQVGRVTDAGFEPDVGVVYEAELDDEALAEGVDAGRYTVSPEIRHVDGGTVETRRGEAMAARDLRFTGLALVQQGASPSASAEPGQAAALEPADVHALLADPPEITFEVNGTEVDATPSDVVHNAVTEALAAKRDRFAEDLDDCGTGVGEQRAEAIRDGDLTPEDFTGGENTAIPDYLDSHAEDVDGLDKPPTEWGEEEWLGTYNSDESRCGPVQFALWGGTATGAGLEWANDVEQALHDAMESEQAAENIPYETTNVSPGDVTDGPGFTDTEWDGSEAVASMPNPSGNEDAPDALDRTHAAVPADESARDDKSSWKLPFRTGPDAPVDTRALVAIDAALSGARGGVEGLSDDVRSAIAEWTQSMLDAAPDDLFGADPDEEDLTQSMPTTAALAAAQFDEGDLVRWQTSASPGTGRVAAVVTEPGGTVESNADVDNPPTREATEDEPVYLLDDWTGDGYNAGQVVKSESEVIGSWDDAPEAARMAQHYDEEADLREVPDEFIYQNPGQATAKAEEMGLDGGDIHQHGEGDDAVFMPGSSHESLIEALREMDELEAAGATPEADDAADEATPDAEDSGDDSDSSQTDTDHNTRMSDNTDDTDPSDELETVKARLADKNERIEDLEAEVEDLRDENERLSDRAEAVDEVEEVISEALAEHVPRDAEALREDLSLEQQREWLAEIDDADAADGVEELEPSPQSGTDGGSGDGDGSGQVAELAGDEREELLAKRTKLERIGDRLSDERCEEVREEAAALAGVESYDEIDFDAIEA